VSGDLLVLGAKDVGGLLDGREREVVAAVRDAYILHQHGRSSLPLSTFLTLPDPTTRIIALAAQLDGDQPVAGIKWVSSFPHNTERGIPRASAVIVLNSLDTGRPIAFMEGAQISAARTAASAGLAAATLAGEPASIGLVGCGLINREILRYCLLLCPSIERVVAFDAKPEHAAALVDEQGIKAEVAPSIEAACAAAELVSFATTAGTPHVGAEAIHAGVATILHVSLRDLDPATLSTVDNVVDDVDHVFRANTSLHLAEQALGRRDFVRATLAQVLEGDTPARAGAGPTVFSPFGLGVLDMAVAQLVVGAAADRGVGLSLAGFLDQ
jgi:N-[(2S)-2-amino-2-carboxyethyl]-L-glutamate dehydrogenase